MGSSEIFPGVHVIRASFQIVGNVDFSMHVLIMSVSGLEIYSATSFTNLTVVGPRGRVWIAFALYGEILYCCTLWVKSTKFGTIIFFDELIDFIYGCIWNSFRGGGVIFEPWIGVISF